jgi:hypothetical protein
MSAACDNSSKETETVPIIVTSAVRQQNSAETFRQ